MSEFDVAKACQIEQDPRFPSGPWTGFFLQPGWPGRHWMDLEIDFQNGNLTGAGLDWVGRFSMSGHYDVESGRCFIAKTYLGQHQVAYEGYNEGKGIWGRWTILTIATGGFHIWPKAWGVSDPSSGHAELEPPFEVVESIALP